jgi:hypothetical protein
MTDYVFPRFISRGPTYIEYNLGDMVWDGDVHLSGTFYLRLGLHGGGYVDSDASTKSFGNNKRLSLRFHGVNQPVHVGDDPNLIWSSSWISKDIANGAVRTSPRKVASINTRDFPARPERRRNSTRSWK